MLSRISFVLVALTTGLFACAAVATNTRAQDREPTTKASAENPEPTPTSLPGAETFIYRELKPEPLRAFVYKPKDWKQGDKRVGFIWFFGGGFTHGTPLGSAGWAKWAAKHGAVGIAPDYRTIWRFKTSAAECVYDARAAMRWVQDHADELGIDPQRIIVGGNSAGGSLALWTAIEKSPPGWEQNDTIKFKPAALILTSAPTDVLNSSRANRFGNHPEWFSPLQNLDEKMPPTIMFHGDADTTVPYDDAVKLSEKLKKSGNDVEFITVPGGQHNYPAEWKKNVQDCVTEFLKKRDLLK